MATLPRLNQRVTIAEKEVNTRGDIAYLPTGQNIQCRLTEESKNVQLSNGEWIMQAAYLHTNFNYELFKGNIILTDKRQIYQIEEVIKTRDLLNNVFMQFCILTEIYAD